MKDKCKKCEHRTVGLFEDYQCTFANQAVGLTDNTEPSMCKFKKDILCPECNKMTNSAHSFIKTDMSVFYTCEHCSHVFSANDNPIKIHNFFDVCKRCQHLEGLPPESAGAHFMCKNILFMTGLGTEIEEPVCFNHALAMQELPPYLRNLFEMSIAVTEQFTSLTSSLSASIDEKRDMLKFIGDRHREKS